MSSIKIKTKPQGTHTLLRILIEHPMETGRRKDEVTGQRIPAHYIDRLSVRHNGKPLLDGKLSTAIAKNPYISLRLSGAQPGDRIEVHWIDNQGDQGQTDYILPSSSSSTDSLTTRTPA
jgi:sulfur-oxidizing protein SoxZ